MKVKSGYAQNGRLDRGLAMRAKVLGDTYVRAALARVQDNGDARDCRRGL